MAYLNDYADVNGLQRPPKLVMTSGLVAEQWGQFGFVSAEALHWTDTVAWAEGGQSVRAPVMAAPGPGDPANPVTTTMRMLPVSAKIAALFLSGLPIREAVKLVELVCQALPVQDRNRCGALVNFMRVAVTDDGNGSTTVNTTWSR
jgi:hypothetical protein